MEFTITGKQGNALVGVFDDQYNLLWSYHLWIGPNRTLATNSHLYSGVSVSWMDRYLGALETGIGTKLYGRGLYYQWGRKDPFVHDGEEITYDSDYIYRKVERNNTSSVDFSKDNPTTFIYNPSPAAVGSWLSDHLEYLWGNQKTIYDPCPPGWKVPAFNSIQSINFTQRLISVIANYFRFKNSTNNLDVHYFKGGYLDGSNGHWRNDSSVALIGSATSDQQGAGVLSIQNSNAVKEYIPVSTATNLRCIKE